MNEKIIGIDLGGTNIRAGIVEQGKLIRTESEKVEFQGSVNDVLDQICSLVDRMGYKTSDGIGIGVPGPVDDVHGIVYELINIPAWKRVELKDILENKFKVPVRVQNDANCFALAEYHFGRGKGCRSFIGLIVGTGIAGGIIIEGKLYSGPNGMAGEFGMMPYLDKYYEYYCCGQFFTNVYGITGKEAAGLAAAGDLSALKMWKEFGNHFGNAIQAIMYAYDPQKIILGGSVGTSLPLYEKQTLEVLQNFVFKNSLANFKLEASALNDPGILGAAALHMI
ncbi:MAG TPA: ROK family protein [Cyclobacteriaceae bacterium]|nr:ROK family protein [Cyclobacteriaceae bacterium]